MREMRRIKQQLSREDSVAILERGSSGVLALLGDEGYPYALPMSYVYHDGKILFHSATTGHKIDAIRNNAKASFCVIDQDHVVPEEYTTYFRSVIVFGKIRIIEQAEEKRKTIEVLGKKYSPDQGEGLDKEIDKSFDHFCMIELAVDHMTGKEAKELMKARTK